MLAGCRTAVWCGTVAGSTTLSTVAMRNVPVYRGDGHISRSRRLGTGFGMTVYDATVAPHPGIRAESPHGHGEERDNGGAVVKIISLIRMGTRCEY